MPRDRKAMGEGIVLELVRDDARLAVAQELFLEFLHWADEIILREYGVSVDADSLHDASLGEAQEFMPPSGRTYLAVAEGRPAGVGCLKQLEPGVAEIKRIFVRPEFRGMGIARVIVEQLVADGRAEGYRTIRLETAGFMKAASGLYRSLGFREIDPYPGRESPREIESFVTFMALDLN